MNSERKAFEDWHFKKYYVQDADREFLYEMFEDKNEYVSYQAQHSWEAWQASAQRQGYKLVPVEPTQKMIESAIIERSKHGRTDSCIYKAMIGAVDE